MAGHFRTISQPVHILIRYGNASRQLSEQIETKSRSSKKSPPVDSADAAGTLKWRLSCVVLLISSEGSAMGNTLALIRTQRLRRRVRGFPQENIPCGFAARERSERQIRSGDSVGRGRIPLPNPVYWTGLKSRLVRKSMQVLICSSVRVLLAFFSFGVMLNSMK